MTKFPATIFYINWRTKINIYHTKKRYLLRTYPCSTYSLTLSDEFDL